MKNYLNLRNGLLLIKQSLKYLLVGGLATSLNYFIFYILLNFAEINYLIASASGFIISVFAGYFFNKKWTFNDSNKDIILILKYFSMYGASLLLSLFLLKTFVSVFLFSPELANVFSIVVTTCVNFIGLKYLVFKK